jgi:hypothetical protein
MLSNLQRNHTSFNKHRLTPFILSSSFRIANYLLGYPKEEELFRELLHSTWRFVCGFL